MTRRIVCPVIKVLGEVGHELSWDDTPEGWAEAESALEELNEGLFAQDASPWVFGLDQCWDPAAYLRKAARR